MQMPSELFYAVTIRRNSPGRYTAGRWVDGAWTDISITGNVQSGGFKEMMHLEEGERSKDTIAVRSPSPIYTIDEVAGKKADRVFYDGVYWEAHKVEHNPGPPELAHYYAVCIREQAK